MNDQRNSNRRPVQHRAPSANRNTPNPTRRQENALQRKPSQQNNTQRRIPQTPPPQRFPQQRPTPRQLSPIQHSRPTTKEGTLYTKSDKIFVAVMAITSIAAIALIIFLLSFAVSRSTGCKNNSKNNDNNDINNTNPPSVSASVMLKETEDMGQDYIDSMIFFGDSNTAHLRSFGVLSGGKQTTQVWATESQTLMLNSEITNKKIVYPHTNTEMTIAEAAALEKPQYIVISLGTNGLTSLNEEQFKYCYTKLLNAIKEASPSTKIIVQSIYPVTSWYENISNEKINAANEWLLELAEKSGVRYIDTASVLKDENGALKEEYNSFHKDGYHVNEAAYKEILKYIRTHGWQ